MGQSAGHPLGMRAQPGPGPGTMAGTAATNSGRHDTHSDGASSRSAPKECVCVWSPEVVLIRC
eukprot:4358078-Prorocentrum_lima.AAC.1